MQANYTHTKSDGKIPQHFGRSRNKATSIIPVTTGPVLRTSEIVQQDADLLLDSATKGRLKGLKRKGSGDFSDGLRAGQGNACSFEGLKSRLFLGRFSRVAGFAMESISFQMPLDQAFSFSNYLPCHLIYTTL
jgi:hypothetical protein